MFNNEFPPLGGGTGTVNLELFKIFETVPDLFIDLISSSADKHSRQKQFSKTIRIFEVPVNKKNIHHATNIELIRYAFKSLKKGFALSKTVKYDLILVWTTVPSGLPALFLSRFRKIPYIVRIGGPDIPGFEERYTFLYKFISPFIKKIWRHADLIITKCLTEKQMIEKISPNLKLKIIYNGIDNYKFYAKTYKTEQPLKLICSARLIKRKGQYTLIEAVSELQKQGTKIQVNLVGTGDETEAYKKYASELNVADKIQFSGYVPREQMPETYRNADIFVLPSYNEGMSNALLEAMASGLPVIVTNVGGTKELVDSNNGFVFQAGCTDELVEIIKKFYFYPDLTEELGKNSAEKSKKYNWQTIADEYINLFFSYQKNN